MKNQKNKALELIYNKISQFQRVLANATYDNRYNEDYNLAYQSTVALLTDLFSEKEAEKFIVKVSTGVAYPKGMKDHAEQLEDHKNHINSCITQLKVFRERIENRMEIDEMETPAESKAIFISHSSNDVKIVGYFIDDILIGSMGFNIRDIFCTSIEGAKIESGEDWRKEIRDNLINAKVIFLIITSNYKSSEMCLNEMGAAWATDNKVIPLVVDPINYSTVGIIQKVKQLEKLNCETSLDRIKDIIQEIFEIPPTEIKSDRWTAKKQDFSKKLDTYLKGNPFPLPFSKDKIEELEKENIQLKSDFENLSNEISKLQNVIKDLRKEKGIKVTNKILQKHKVESGVGEFDSLIKKASKLLSHFHPTIISLIYNKYSGKRLSIDIGYYSSPLNEANARNYIDEDFNVLWNETSEMGNVHSALQELDEFIGGKITSDTYDDLSKRYSTPLDIRNLNFWEEVLGLGLCYRQ